MLLILNLITFKLTLKTLSKCQSFLVRKYDRCFYAYFSQNMYLLGIAFIIVSDAEQSMYRKLVVAVYLCYTMCTFKSAHPWVRNISYFCQTIILRMYMYMRTYGLFVITFKTVSKAKQKFVLRICTGQWTTGYENLFSHVQKVHCTPICVHLYFTTASKF